MAVLHHRFDRKLTRAAFGGAALSVILASAGGAADLAPYRAAYTLRLDSTGSGASVVDARGAMTAEWAEGCDGWTVQQRIVLELVNANDEGLVTDTGFTSWESRDGLSYRFSLRTMRNDQLAEEYRGDAKIPGVGKAGEARYTVPENRTMALPAGTLFPMVHSAELVKAAEAGKHTLVVVVFDGATKEGMAEISAFIGGQQTPDAKEKGEALTNRSSWPVRLAFFNAGADAAEPQYELSLKMYDNGVAGDQIMDFGDFRVRAKLLRLEPLPKPKC
ncbi:MAG: cell envelope integrity EipB family protein [Alphaproteobacteria bacterium]